METKRVCEKCGCELASDSNSPCPGCLLKIAANDSHAKLNDSFPPTQASKPKHAFTTPTVEEVGKLVPHLHVEALLGCGGMGAVYRARQPELDRVVAVKVLPQQLGRDSDHEQRFRREARALAKLNHPHIITLYDFGRSPELIYFVMEFVDGVTLREAIASRNLNAGQALSIVSQICDALQYAHEEGIVHRDIKPENVLIDGRGRVKVADFGLAKLLASDATNDHLTGTAQVMGTMHYMAPEQMSATKSVDHRADIYSLGVVFYELLTGEIPMGWFPPPSKRVNVDVRLDQVVLRTLESEPSRRYQQISEVKVAVDKLNDNDGPSQPAASLPPMKQLAKHSSKALITHQLLDVTDTRNRILHHALLLVAVALCLVGGLSCVALAAGNLEGSRLLAVRTVAAVTLFSGVLLSHISHRVKRRLRWEVTYKQHRIVFDGGGAFAEKLYLDDGLVQAGGFGLKMEIRTQIKAGEGIGDWIVALYDARFLMCRCRIVAEEALPHDDARIRD